MSNIIIGKNNNPIAIIIFGGTGDLAKTKLFPALLDLYVAGELPSVFTIIGLSRKELSDADYQTFVAKSIAEKGHHHAETVIQSFCTHLHYVAGSFAESSSYKRIKAILLNFDESIGQCTNKLFYLAVPPQYYEEIFEQLHQSNALALCAGLDSWSRLLVEKPFGRDLVTAQALEHKLCTLFQDEQIYRIDHYLAKDAIENIISLRFANSILADSWNKERIESITIRLLETKDVANRGSFYDGIGTLRDVGQNHMLQILALLTIPAVDVHDATQMRAARTAVLQTLLTTSPDSVIRGQYNGYRQTLGVAPDSETETYFKISTVATTPVWRGVRYTLEAGKALDRSINETIITFKALDQCHCASKPDAHTHQNVLTITFAPTQKMSLTMWVKKPGFIFELEQRELELLHTATTDSHSPEAYERVLYDCIVGDQTRFVSGAEVETAWQFITPILEHFKTLPLHTYEPGSAGPVDASRSE